MPRTESMLERDGQGADRTGLDRAALDGLIAKQYTGLRLLILRRTRDREIAADLLNEAVCTTWEKWQAGLIQRPDQIGGYIFRVAMNLLRNHRRSANERVPLRTGPDVIDSLPDDADATDQWLEKKIAFRVKRVLLQMNTSRDREILTRLYLHEEDKETICRDLQLDAQQFDKVLHRARGRLRQLLESDGLKRSDFFVLCLA